jgi:hypothetical protein
MAYQRFYDPPGNRLLKMHLAGVDAIDSRSVWQAIEDAYESRSAATLLRYKWANIATLIGPEPIKGLTAVELAGRQGDSKGTDLARVSQREYIWNSVGIINIGWLVLLGLFLRKNKKRALPYSGWIILAALLNFLVWCILLFRPAGTITASSSYTDILLLSIGLLGFLLTLPRFAIVVLLAIQLFNFFAVWVWFRPPTVPTATNAAAAPALQVPVLILGLACATGLVWHFVASFKQSREQPLSS